MMSPITTTVKSWKPINVSLDVKEHILYTKNMLEMTERFKDLDNYESYSIGNVIKYALDELIKNDKELFNLNRTLMYNIERGRLRPSN